MAGIILQPQGMLGVQTLFQNLDTPGLLGAPERLRTWLPSVFILSWLSSLTEQAPGGIGTLDPPHQSLVLWKGKLRPRDRKWNGLKLGP